MIVLVLFKCGIEIHGIDQRLLTRSGLAQSEGTTVRPSVIGLRKRFALSVSPGPEGPSTPTDIRGPNQRRYPAWVGAGDQIKKNWRVGNGLQTVKLAKSTSVTQWTSIEF